MVVVRPPARSGDRPPRRRLRRRSAALLGDRGNRSPVPARPVRADAGSPARGVAELVGTGAV